MYKIITMLLALSLIGCGSIDSNHAGVVTGFTGKVNTKELGQGFYTAFTSSVDEYSCKEITVAVDDLTPKTADNLSLQDFDLEIYYFTDCGQVAELHLKYTDRAGVNSKGIGLPAYYLVRSFGRETAYKVAATYDSLEMHKHRDEIGETIKAGLVARLNESDPDRFTITKVIVRSLVTDPDIEESIKLAVAKDKELEAKSKDIEIALQEAQANINLNASLTDAVLRNKELNIMDKAISTDGARPFLMFGMSNASPLININK